MNDQAASVQPESSPVQARAAAPSAPLWHLGWAVAALTAAAALMAALGALSPTVAGALALAAAPGLIGYFWQPQGQQRLGFLALWALAVTAAASLVGGATGPLAVWCVAPLLAGGLMAKPAEGIVASAVALAVLVLVQVAGMVSPPPAGAYGVGLAAAGLVIAGGAAAGALGVLMRRARDRAAAHAAEQAWMNGVMAELPHLALALAKDGRCEAVFGAALPGLDVEALREGLVAAAVEPDRAAVKAAMCEAFDHGAGETDFHPAGAPQTIMALSLRRRGEEGLVALIRESERAADSAKAEALWREQVARTVAETRVHVLENKLRITERARDSALNELGDAKTAREAADQARQVAEAGAVAKSRFLANMSHELRTPLNAIMGFSDIMRQRMFGELLPKYGEYAELIHESGRHLTDLINDVLDMSKIEAERYSLDKDLFDAREPVSGALRLMRLQADDAGVQLRGVLPQQALMVDADRRALKQIVLNLVSNALKFTPAGGSITVTLQPVDDVLELVVADTGVGIAKEDLERLGRPYEQAGDAEHKAQGTGLGLSLVRAFARLHGGEMIIESELGEGAAVTVRLPVLHVEETPAPPQNGPEPEVVAAPEAEIVDEAPEGLIEAAFTRALAQAQQAPRLIPVGEDAMSTTVIDPSAAEETPETQAHLAPRSAEVIPFSLPRS